MRNVHAAARGLGSLVSRLATSGRRRRFPFEALSLQVKLWDGRTLGVPDHAARCRVYVADPAALVRLAVDRDMAFGDLYTQGRIEVDGLAALLTQALRVRAGEPGRLRQGLRALAGGRIGRDSERRNTRHHDDAGNDFYELWLDDGMVHSSAYFADPAMSLEDAQIAKLDHVCRKLRLRAGERVIDVGSGWGGLALHMAAVYGVRVRGFNVSRTQNEYARERAARAGLSSHLEFVEDDYRDIREACDALVSIGMLEHVGGRHYEDFGRTLDRCLAPDGRALIQTIGRARPTVHPWIARGIFPEGYIPSLSEMLQIVESVGLEVFDVENLRPHCALTLRHWMARYRTCRAQVRELVGDEQTRAWELYLAGVWAAFEAHSIQLYQVLCARAACSRLPATRDHLYAQRKTRRSASRPRERQPGALYPWNLGMDR